ncbi:MAG: DUF1501 domain-containing protein [Proteobacteria bacterium]|nr:MAG: DUF1501 domain-containing protein [Pseudomonadota bacterium]
MSPIWDVLKNRFKKPGLASVLSDPSLGASSGYQLDVLKTGLPELNNKNTQADITALRALMENGALNKVVESCAEKGAIQGSIASDRGFVDKLVLAGILAKTGLAHGMTIDAMGDDRHNGGADVHTARSAAAKWASISVFWNWIKAAGLQNDVMIVVGQEFARSPYNKSVEKVKIINEKGQEIEVSAPGRDHSLAMGTMFINGNVPKAGRVGFVGDNMAAQATKDAKGTIDTSGTPYTSENIVGSMLLRAFDDLFPTERMVRKHWPTFKEIGPILA